VLSLAAITAGTKIPSNSVTMHYLRYTAALCRWSYSEAASWDLVAVYFGSNDSWTCPEVEQGCPEAGESLCVSSVARNAALVTSLAVSLVVLG
jgi:hypothetical protein